MTISRLLLPKRPRLTVVLSAVLAPSLLAVETTQSLPLRYGWNAVWLEVGPADENGQALTADQIFKSPDFSIDRVASPLGQICKADFTSAQSPFTQGGCDVGVANPQSGETASIAVRANYAYLIHASPNSGVSAADGTAAGSLEIQGEVAFYRAEWVRGEFNLAGFGIQSPTTFASLMAASGVVVDSPLGEVANIQKLDASSGLMIGSFTLKNDPDPTDTTPPIALQQHTVNYAGVLVPRLGMGVGQFQLAELPSQQGAVKTTLSTSPIWSGQVILK
jgi:hypothetical protein